MVCLFKKWVPRKISLGNTTQCQSSFLFAELDNINLQHYCYFSYMFCILHVAFIPSYRMEEVCMLAHSVIPMTTQSNVKSQKVT